MANLAVTLELDSQGYIRNIRAADSATQQFAKDATSGTKEVDSAFGRLNTTSDRLVTSMTKLKATLLGAAFVGFARSSIQAADAINDLSEATDLSVGKILQLQEALVQSGGKADSAGKIITQFYKSIDEARMGSDKTQEALAKLGITFDMLKTATPEQMLQTAADKLAGITDPAQRTALALDIFGKSMIGVSPARFAEELGLSTAEFEKQAAAIQRAAELNDQWEKSITKIRLAFLEAFGPMIQGLAKALEIMPNLITAFKVLGAVIVGVFVATGLRTFISLLGMAGRGVAALIDGFSKLRSMGGLGKALSGNANNKGIASLRDAATATGLVGGVAVGGALLMNGQEETKAPAPGADAVKSQVNNTVQIGKELQSQLNSVQSLADGYRRAAQANMDRLTTEVEMLGKSKEEADTMKGLADINKRYADQTAALEDKKKGAKGATLALINKEIANLQELKNSEIDVYNITRQQTIQYARQQQEVKNIIDLMEQQAEAAREIAEFQNQQNQAILSAYQLVKTQKEAFELTGQREALEKSIQNLRSSEQSTIKELFDLENQRKVQLEAIQKIQNLPFEGVGGMKQKMQEINDLYDARKLKIEETAAKTKEEQASFAYGWEQAGEKYRNNIKTDAEYAAQQMGNFTKGIEDAFVKFVQTGKLSIKDLANSMIADFARVQAQKMLSGIFGNTGGGGGGGMGGIFGFLGGLFKANGGPVAANSPYIVGERGPELFVPNNAGKVVPNNALGGGQSVVNNTTAVSYNIQAVDASSFRSLVARDPEFIHNVSEQGRRSMPIRSRR
jgi:lambda family phage tail tape measure protein